MKPKDKFPFPKAWKLLMGRSMRLAARDRKPRLLEIELTHCCAGECRYCFASSLPESRNFLDTVVIRQVLDDAAKLGIRMIWWLGGDPFLHPKWVELVQHAAQLRMAQAISTSGLISKSTVRKLIELKKYINLSFHIDSVVPETYAMVNRRPNTLKVKMQGYKTLLDSGFPPNQISGVITLTRPVVSTFERTLNWFMDEMGAIFVLIRVFKPLGMGAEAVQLEPGLDEVKYCQALRNAKHDEELPFSCTDLGPYVCRTNIGIHPDGEVTPCLFLSNQGLGNVNQDRLHQIAAQYRNQLFFNFDLEGPCRTCDKQIDPMTMCMGCRVNALAYTGNLRGSDPKCWRNPDAPQFCLT